MFNGINGAELILLRGNDAGKGDYEFQATLATETARNGQVPVAHGFNQMDAFEPEGEDANFFTFQAESVNIQYCSIVLGRNMDVFIIQPEEPSCYCSGIVLACSFARRIEST